jgi:hypothetical protein
MTLARYAKSFLLHALGYVACCLASMVIGLTIFVILTAIYVFGSAVADGDSLSVPMAFSVLMVMYSLPFAFGMTVWLLYNGGVLYEPHSGEYLMCLWPFIIVGGLTLMVLIKCMARRRPSQVKASSS